jgi:hypothetical protein
MEKVMFTITAPQARWLRARAAELDISSSELVRRVLDQERERVGERALETQQPGDDASETEGRATNIVAEDKDMVIEESVESFHRDMEDLYYRCGRQLRYWPNRYLQEVRRKGGLACAKALLARPRSYGLERLAAEGRTDLSVEALVLDPRYEDLFSPEERAVASRRLAEARGE